MRMIFPENVSAWHSRSGRVFSRGDDATVEIPDEMVADAKVMGFTEIPAPPPPPPEDPNGDVKE